MRSVMVMCLFVMGCSVGDPLDRVIEVEKKSTEVLKSEGTCQEVTERWKEYRSSLAEEGPYEAAFDYVIDIIERTGVDSKESKELEDRFCDFLIAHQESAYWFLKKDCIGSSFFLGMKYHGGSQFEKEVRYVNRKFSGMPVLVGFPTLYWTRNCSPRSKAALKVLKGGK